jgi:hypothetical protein
MCDNSELKCQSNVLRPLVLLCTQTAQGSRPDTYIRLQLRLIIEALNDIHVKHVDGALKCIPEPCFSLALKLLLP